MRPLALAFAVSVTATVLSGCSTGFDAQTVQVYSASDGSDIREGDVSILSAVVVADAEGNGGVLSAGFVGPTDQDDALTSVEVTDDEGTALTTEIADGTVDIPGGQLVLTADGAGITITGAELTPGTLLDVAFSFARAAPVSGEVPVVEPEGAYAEVPTVPAPSLEDDQPAPTAG